MTVHSRHQYRKNRCRCDICTALYTIHRRDQRRRAKIRNVDGTFDCLVCGAKFATRRGLSCHEAVCCRLVN